ncbi:hypothetical protein HUG15_17255 [Salicibibacter cibarius]|uniref:Uncharacterized protein n=1 Tax=Salicibibacter cibarius TaxID=2743000 RepID=A0A7T7CCQ2_9BACI|nr:hypothetical protein HUG15_17255 [Salicibibacter cibarius]
MAEISDHISYQRSGLGLKTMVSTGLNRVKVSKTFINDRKPSCETEIPVLKWSWRPNTKTNRSFSRHGAAMATEVF